MLKTQKTCKFIMHAFSSLSHFIFHSFIPHYQSIFHKIKSVYVVTDNRASTLAVIKCFQVATGKDKNFNIICINN